MSIDKSGRGAGILMPVFSLPSRFEIGCFSQEAYEFVDWLAEAGQRYWQMLPLGPVDTGGSPYQSRSCFAGEPLYIDPLTLLRRGLITREELDAATDGLEHAASAQPVADESTEHGAETHDGLEHAARRVDYAAVMASREHILRIAYSRFEPGDMFEAFCQRNSYWLDDYAVFEAFCTKFGTSRWDRWPTAVRFKIRWKMKEYKALLAEEIGFRKWTQYEFYRQWAKLKRYANLKGVRIIGDMPIYASLESADCWAHSELFQLGGDGLPTRVAGAPPDAFNADGQKWGNPLYDWDLMKKRKYQWWIDRVRHNLRVYDVVRLDHMRGFESYFAIPAEDDDARNGQWEPGPGQGFFRVLREHLGDCPLIAEDLGDITPEVRAMVRASGLPGMKVLQFAFDGNPQNEYLPVNYEENTVVYTGTHDNDTTAGWYASLDEKTKRMITLFIRSNNGVRDGEHAPLFGASAACQHLVEIAQKSRANICVVPLQDYLELGSEHRINTPGTMGGNWSWRMPVDACTGELARHICEITVRSGRRERKE